MSDMSSGADPTRTVMTLDDETLGLSNAHLLPNPNPMSNGSLTELSIFPLFKKRLGLNMCGSG